MENPFLILESKLNEIKDLLVTNNNVSQSNNNIQKFLYTKREAANELSCSVPMIDKLIQQGRLDKIKVGAKVLIPNDSIENIKERVINVFKNDTNELVNDSISEINYCENGFIDITCITLQKCGIYFFYFHDIVVYVGKSTNLLGRISNHLQQNKISFTSCKILKVNKSYLDIYEQAFIKVLRPKYNGCLNGDYNNEQKLLVSKYFNI